VVEHGFTGFLHEPAHVAGYTASVLKLLANDGLRRTMGRRARRVAIERFGAEEMVGKYVEVYESLR
jgi:glycosyltransferase involved in cell wall biosynthesis